jgi:general secretion pathway protein D
MKRFLLLYKTLHLGTLCSGLTLTLSALGPALAQSPPPSPNAPTQGTAGTPPPAAAASSYSPIGSDATIKVNFPNTPIQAIIPFYIQLTGKKIILDSSLQGESLKMIAPEPLTKQEAINFIHATLLLNGYAIIPKGDSTVMLIHHQGGKSPTPEGLPVISSIRDLPTDEQIVHFVMPLEHISADDASKAFKEVVKLHAYGAITPIANSSAIIITENTATIRSLYDIAQIVDVPPAEIANELIPLERSDAERIAEIINEIYAQQEDSSSGTAGQQPAPAQPGNTPPASINPTASSAVTAAAGSANTANTNPTAAKVRVIADRRTNSLLVIARPVDITYIRGLVEKLDQQTGGITFMKRKLSFMNVADFLPVAYDSLSRDTDIQNESGGLAINGGGGGGLGTGSASPRNSSTPSTNANRGGDTNAGFAGGGFGGGLGGGTGFGGNSNRSLLDDPEQKAAPQSLVVGRTLLIADSQSNSLIVSGSPEHIAIIDQLLGEIDVRPQQIYISTIIGQLTLNDETKFGFDFLRLLDDFSLQQNITTNTSSRSGTDTSTFNTDIDANGIPTTTGTATGERINTFNSDTAPGEPGDIVVPLALSNFNWNSLNLYGQLGAISRYINLLERDTNFKVMSRPSVYTTNNGKAVISSGQRIAVPTQILSNGAGIGGIASTSASIDYRDVVLKLEVVPLINSDDEVTLRIAQINDNIIGEQVISGNTIPTLSTQELVTTVTVKNGGTVVLGGLITERAGDNSRGTIFLRRIPIIKHLFGVTTKTSTRDELLIFIQPNIINTKSPVDAPNHIERGRSRLMDDTIQFGVPRGRPYTAGDGE